MENQTTAPEVQSEQTENVVQNNTEATPQTVLTETEQPKEVNFKDLIPENFREEKALDNFNNMEDFVKSYLHAQKLVGADKKFQFQINMQPKRIGMKFLKGLVLLAIQMITNTISKIKKWIKDKYKNLIKQHTD